MNQERLTNINKRSVSVVLREFSNSEHLEKALRDLKKQLKKDNFYKEIRKREYYTSPSEKKKLKKRRKTFTTGEDLVT
tara:strand:- start:196 stop:429 length:234 start_codon:yes stop_codon:yes gene_type:complete